MANKAYDEGFHSKPPSKKHITDLIDDETKDKINQTHKKSIVFMESQIKLTTQLGTWMKYLDEKDNYMDDIVGRNQEAHDKHESIPLHSDKIIDHFEKQFVIEQWLKHTGKQDLADFETELYTTPVPMPDDTLLFMGTTTEGLVKMMDEGKLGSTTGYEGMYMASHFETAESYHSGLVFEFEKGDLDDDVYLDPDLWHADGYLQERHHGQFWDSGIDFDKVKTIYLTPVQFRRFKPKDMNSEDFLNEYKQTIIGVKYRRSMTHPAEAHLRHAFTPKEFKALTDKYPIAAATLARRSIGIH